MKYKSYLLTAAFFICCSLILPMAQSQAASLGNGRVTSVVGVGGSCTSGPDGDSVQSWEVAQGGTYEITLSNVNDCGNGGTYSTIQVVVKSSESGNRCLTATKLQNGVYVFRIKMADVGCNTLPITYCTCNCGPDTGKFARRSDGGEFQAHLRMATFDGNCNFVAYDADCAPPCGGNPFGAITACKFYDFNANGIFDPSVDQRLPGWPICIQPLPLNSEAIPQDGSQLTDSFGCTSWDKLAPGQYTVSEGTPYEISWKHSTDSSVVVDVQANSNPSIEFGNYCEVPSGGKTLGFWSNQNGKAILLANDPAWRILLNGCCLRKADGSVFTVSTVVSFPTAYSTFRSWLLNAKATNMAYMLSAQLAAMKLNIAYGFVDGNAFNLCSGTTINDLVNTANSDLVAGLCNDGLTPAGDPNRSTQESWKNCLDALNNGGPVVPTVPCVYTFTDSTVCP